MVLKNSVAKIFDSKPRQWGLRGDPYLWRALQQLFVSIPLPCSKETFTEHFDEFFQEITNHSLHDHEEFFIDRFSHGGMSSGYISPKYWRKHTLPFLIDNLYKENNHLQENDE